MYQRTQNIFYKNSIMLKVVANLRCSVIQYLQSEYNENSLVWKILHETIKEETQEMSTSNYVVGISITEL